MLIVAFFFPVIRVSLLRVGELATEGVVQVAETGNCSTLLVRASGSILQMLFTGW